MNKTTIEWVKNPDGSQGYTWNPITGCLNNCPHCYARKLAEGRLRDRYLVNTNTAPVYAEGGEEYTKANKMLATDPFFPRFWPNRLWDLPVEPVAKPRGIFVCDMSDLFGNGVPKEWTDRVIARLWWGEQHRYYLLTKQPQNLIKFPYLHSFWVGFTATNTAEFQSGTAHIARVEARQIYVSLEPLLSWEMGASCMAGYLEERNIGQVIVGAQTRPYKPPKIEWVREIAEACGRAGAHVFLKDNLYPLILKERVVADRRLFGPEGTLRQEIPK